MANDRDPSETDPPPGPQTPAARRRAAGAPPGPVERELSEIEAGAEAEVRRLQAQALREVMGAPAGPVDRPVAPAPAPSRPAPPRPAPPRPAKRARRRPAAPTSRSGGPTPAGIAPPSPPSPEMGRPPATVHPPARDAKPAPARAPAPPAGGARGQLSTLALLASGVGVLLVLLASGDSRELPAASLASLSAEPTATALAPGGRLELAGAGAPEGTRMLLETRAADGDWRVAGEAIAGDNGRFRIEGRVVARPGRMMVRSRASGLGTSEPVGLTVRPLRLASVGDINLGDTPGVMIGSDGPRYPWASVGRRLRMADIAFGNLECAVSTRGSAFPKQFNFRGTPAALAGLRRHSGLDVLNLANNHVGDYGQTALLDTVGHVERLGMRAVGAGAGLRRALEPQVVERLGLRVAFVGFSEIAPVEFAAAAGRPGTAWASTENVSEAVRAARQRADVVVATFHWGMEKAPVESAQQQALARAASAAGANLVIGAHPHVLQPVKREGSALVAYSLGNFVFGALSDDTTATGILETDLTGEGVSAGRWRPARIMGSRPLMDRAEPRPLPLEDDAALSAGASL